MNPTLPPQNERIRVSLDLSPIVAWHLDNICAVTGQNRAAVVSGALLESLPALIEQAAALKKAHDQYLRDQSKGGKR